MSERTEACVTCSMSNCATDLLFEGSLSAAADGALSSFRNDRLFPSRSALLRPYPRLAWPGPAWPGLALPCPLPLATCHLPLAPCHLLAAGRLARPRKQPSEVPKPVSAGQWPQGNEACLPPPLPPARTFSCPATTKGARVVQHDPAPPESRGVIPPRRSANPRGPTDRGGRHCG